MSEEIRFYRVQDPYGELSNFAPFPVQLRGRRWPTSEHFFQAQKFAGTEHEEAIRQASSPTVAARMGRSRQRPLRADWEEVKDRLMLEAVRAKLAQHPGVRSLLLGTGEARLVERTARDSYWGDGGDGTGQNRLGQILMQVRRELRRVELWRKIIAGGQKSWVLFAEGTCVVLPAPGQDDLAGAARRILEEHGPVRPGTPSGDFSVTRLADGPGWIVGGDHPDVLVHVAPDEVSTDATDLAVGLVGRGKRDADARQLEVLHVEDRRS